MIDPATVSAYITIVDALIKIFKFGNSAIRSGLSMWVVDARRDVLNVQRYGLEDSLRAALIPSVGERSSHWAANEIAHFVDTLREVTDIYGGGMDQHFDARNLGSGIIKYTSYLSTLHMALNQRLYDQGCHFQYGVRYSIASDGQNLIYLPMPRTTQIVRRELGLSKYLRWGFMRSFHYCWMAHGSSADEYGVSLIDTASSNTELVPIKSIERGKRSGYSWPDLNISVDGFAFHLWPGNAPNVRAIEYDERAWTIRCTPKVFLAMISTFANDYFEYVSLNYGEQFAARRGLLSFLGS